jgi:hypothetical protein
MGLSSQDRPEVAEIFAITNLGRHSRSSRTSGRPSRATGRTVAARGRRRSPGGGCRGREEAPARGRTAPGTADLLPTPRPVAAAAETPEIRHPLAEPPGTRGPARTRPLRPGRGREGVPPVGEPRPAPRRASRAASSGPDLRHAPRPAPPPAPTAARSAVRLRVLVGAGAGKAVEVREPRFFIGRDLSCHSAPTARPSAASTP